MSPWPPSGSRSGSGSDPAPLVGSVASAAGGELGDPSLAASAVTESALAVWTFGLATLGLATLGAGARGRRDFDGAAIGRAYDGHPEAGHRRSPVSPTSSGRG